MSQYSTESSFPCSSYGGDVRTEIPCLGFGTATLKGDGAVEKIAMAIREGYRMLDTALLYGNHQEVGEAVRDSGVPREEFWITTKVSFFPAGDPSMWMYNANNLVGDEISSLDLSLQQLSMSYVDLCLLHNPCGSAVEYNVATLPHFFELFNECGYVSAVKPEKLADGTILRDFIMENKRKDVELVDKAATYEIRKNSWLNMESALAQRKCRRIGVSNYTAELLLEMQEYATVMPAVNEVELHPRFCSPHLLRVCRDLNIVLIGYGTGHYISIDKAIERKMGAEMRVKGVLDSVCSRTGKSRMQVVLRWMLQLGVVSVPRSSQAEHMRHNRDICDFELTAAEMERIGSLNENHPYYWDPVPTNMTIAAKH